MKIVDLPPELFGYLSEFWKGRSLLRLYSTGDHKLLKLLTGPHGVRSFDWTESPAFVNAQIRVAFLANLRHLNLRSEVTTLMAQHVPEFPASLETINLRIPQSIDIWFSHCRVPQQGPPYNPSYTMTPLSKLQSLSLWYRNGYQLSQIWQTLPDSLVRLSVTDPSNSSSEEIELPATLPSSLEELEFHARLNLGEQEVVWPSHLTSLHLPNSMWTVRAGTLPQTLTSLNLGFNFFTPYLTDEEVEGWQQCFAHLQSLSVRTNHSWQLLHILKSSELHTLTLTNSLTIAELDLLPASLTFLQMSVSKPVKAAQLYERLPKALKTFRMDWQGDRPWMINNRWLSKLPSKLETLSIENCEVLSAEFVHMMPDTLTECPLFDTAKLSHAAIESLPRVLRKLCIAKRSERLALSSSDCQRLPPSLDYLEIEAIESELSDTCLRNLPRHLKTFIHSSNTSFSDFGLPHLPPTLTVLHLPNNTTISDAGVARLPPTLTELILRGDSHTLTAKCIATLPRSLKGLYLQNITGISDDNLKDLPQGLESINLPGPNLTSIALALLPHTIRRCVFRDNKSINIRSLRTLPKAIEFLGLTENPNFKGIARKKIPSYLNFITAHFRYKSKQSTASLWDLSKL